MAEVFNLLKEGSFLKNMNSGTVILESAQTAIAATPTETAATTAVTAASKSAVASTAVPASACLDRRIVRTKRAIRSALIDLMEQRGFGAFTVNDLCEHADINRGTFYNHYKDLPDALASFEGEVLQNLDTFRSPMSSLDLASIVVCVSRREPLPFLVSLFDYLREEGDFLHAAMGPGGDVGFGPCLRDSVCAYMVQSILHKRYRENPTPFVDYYVAFFASAYLGVITRWIETGMKESSREMALISQRLLFIKPGESIEL